VVVRFSIIIDAVIKVAPELQTQESPSKVSNTPDSGGI